jgi:hypothetical protein
LLTHRKKSNEQPLIYAAKGFFYFVALPGICSGELLWPFSDYALSVQQSSAGKPLPRPCEQRVASGLQK